MNVLAFDVGGTSIKYGLVSDTLEIISKDKFSTPENEEKLIDLFSKIIEDNLSDISKVSVAMPGYVNLSNNKYLYGAHLKYDIDFSKLSKFSEYEFYLDNDANVAAYCEYFLNYKNKYSNLIMLTFGTGVGGGIISENKLLRGKVMQERLDICLPQMIEKSKGLTEKKVVLNHQLLHQYGQTNV